MIKRLGILTSLVLAGSLLVGPASHAAETGFKGKTIIWVVGFSPGGGFDTYTRLIARHFGKYVPGNPTSIVRNMPGAGSLIAANYMYNKAKADGTYIGNWIGPVVMQHVMGNKAAKLDGRKFGWLGAPTADSGVCVLTKASGINNLDDWFAAKKPVKIGSTAPGSTTDDVPKLVRAATGLPMQLVEGYGGTARIRVAAESGEVDGGCWSWQSIKATWSDALESGRVKAVIQSGLESHPDLKGVPMALSYAKTAEARKLLEVAGGVYGMGARPHTVSPRTPKAILRLLRKAYQDTLRDPQLLAEAKKSRLEINPQDGPTLAKMFAGLYDIDPAMLSRLKEILLP